MLSDCVKVGMAVAAVTGLTGAPLNSFIARWASRVPGNVGTRLGTAGAGVALVGGQEFVQGGSQQAIENIGVGRPVWEGVLDSSMAADRSSISTPHDLSSRHELVHKFNRHARPSLCLVPFTVLRWSFNGRAAAIMTRND